MIDKSEIEADLKKAEGQAKDVVNQIMQLQKVLQTLEGAVIYMKGKLEAWTKQEETGGNGEEKESEPGVAGGGAE